MVKINIISCQNLYPFSDQNSSKTIPFGAAHTYVAYIGEYPPPPRANNLLYTSPNTHSTNICCYVVMLHSYLTEAGKVFQQLIRSLKGYFMD